MALALRLTPRRAFPHEHERARNGRTPHRRLSQPSVIYCLAADMTRRDHHWKRYRIALKARSIGPKSGLLFWDRCNAQSLKERIGRRDPKVRSDALASRLFKRAQWRLDRLALDIRSAAARATMVWRIRTGGRQHPLPGKLVVSLTSYPPRFAALPLTMRSLLCQAVKPDRHRSLGIP